MAQAYVSPSSCPLTVRYVLLPKKSLSKSHLPSGVRGRFSRSSVVTRKSCPAPSQSLAVMIGVWTYRKPRCWKNSWMAAQTALRTRATAPNVLVRIRRWACVRRNSLVCRLG